MARAIHGPPRAGSSMVKPVLQVDQLGDGGLFASRSKLIQDAVAEKLQRLQRARLAQECAKLQPRAEQAAAEERFQGEAEWPETSADSVIREELRAG